MGKNLNMFDLLAQLESGYLPPNSPKVVQNKFTIYMDKRFNMNWDSQIYSPEHLEYLEYNEKFKTVADFIDFLNLPKSSQDIVETLKHGDLK